LLDAFLIGYVSVIFMVCRRKANQNPESSSPITHFKLRNSIWHCQATENCYSRKKVIEEQWRFCSLRMIQTKRLTANYSKGNEGKRLELLKFPKRLTLNRPEDIW